MYGPLKTSCWHPAFESYLKHWANSQSPPQRSLSSFRLSGRLENGERGNKACGGWGEGKWLPQSFNFPIFFPPPPPPPSPFSHLFSTEGASAEEREGQGRVN